MSTPSFRGIVRSVRPAQSIDAFVRAPVERYIIGNTYVVWSASPTLCGSVHWGVPDESDARALMALFEIASGDALAARFDVVTDDRAVERVDAEAFALFGEYVRTSLPRWGERIRRQVVLVPSGMAGIVLAGLVPVLGPTYPISFFEDAERAIAALDRSDAAEAFARVESIVADARGVSPALRALREYVAANLETASVRGAAKAAGMSVRTLQRILAETNSTFSDELNDGRLRAAMDLLVGTDLKVDVIAQRCGCSTAYLALLFKQKLGVTPARFRAEQRQRASTVRADRSRRA